MTVPHRPNGNGRPIARPLGAEGDRSARRWGPVAGICLLALVAIGLGLMPG
ncbi:hypothetical protein [Gemmobacter sp.]|uniref:hypothetical protein n=1 Tax=Gemmobacter sp. TaxID=1898957 RepID=UPI002AFE1FCB|nr:hypothetical protein [Gemmobacter sp.]